MIKRQDTLRSYKLDLIQDNEQELERYFGEFLQEDNRLVKGENNNTYTYFLAVDRVAAWILEVGETSLNHTIVPERSLNPVLWNHNYRIKKHHFFFSIELEVERLENGSHAIQIVNEHTNEIGYKKNNQIQTKEVIILEGFEKGIKKVLINKWIHDSIVKFCRDLGVTGYRFRVSDYKYQAADSTVVAVYYTVINCLAEVFGLKPYGELIIDLSDLVK